MRRKMERNKIKNFYAQEMEANRLELEAFKLEGIRTKEIIERYIQKNNLEILDIGGGAGYYSFWLQEKGHNVTLVDLSPKNIELVRKHAETIGRVLKKFETGDAVNLSFSNEQFDLVLLLDVYHLTDRNEDYGFIGSDESIKTQRYLAICLYFTLCSLIDGFQRD